MLADLTPSKSASLLEFSERLGLISRRSSASGVYRYHPLVRDMLEARLKASVGEAGVRALHQAAGDWARDTDRRAATTTSKPPPTLVRFTRSSTRPLTRFRAKSDTKPLRNISDVTDRR